MLYVILISSVPSSSTLLEEEIGTGQDHLKFVVSLLGHHKERYATCNSLISVNYGKQGPGSGHFYQDSSTMMYQSLKLDKEARTFLNELKCPSE